MSPETIHAQNVVMAKAIGFKLYFYIVAAFSPASHVHSSCSRTGDPRNAVLWGVEVTAMHSGALDQ